MTLISSSADCKAAPETTCSRILSEAGLKAWWIGSVKIAGADPNWPGVGTRMSWKAGGGTFQAEIKKDERPRCVEMTVDTPAANSYITHTFEELPGGGSRYTKSVVPVWRSGVFRLLGPLFVPLLRASIRKEVQRAAMFADS